MLLMLRLIIICLLPPDSAEYNTAAHNNMCVSYSAETGVSPH